MKSYPMCEGNNQTGAAILEMTICLGLVMIFLTGIVDGWNFNREADYLALAARHGARVAAARSNILEFDGQRNLACTDIAGTSSALTVGVRIANEYLKSTKLETTSCIAAGVSTRTCPGTNYTASAQFLNLCEDGFGQRSIRVTVTANNPSKCFLCLFQLMGRRNLSASSVYPVEAECTNLAGVVVCP